MGDLCKAGGRRGTHPARRAVGTDQLGKARLDRRVAAAQRIVLGVGDLGCSLGMIESVVPLDLVSQPSELVARLFLGQRFDRAQLALGATLPRRGRSAHARPPAIRLAAAARASAVTTRPDSMRAISSCLVSGSSSSTRVTVWRSASPLATRQ